VSVLNKNIIIIILINIQDTYLLIIQLIKSDPRVLPDSWGSSRSCANPRATKLLDKPFLQVIWLYNRLSIAHDQCVINLAPNYKTMPCWTGSQCNDIRWISIVNRVSVLSLSLNCSISCNRFIF